MRNISDSDNLGDKPVLRCLASVREFYDNPFALKLVDADLGPGFCMARRRSPLPLLMVCYAGCAWFRQGADDAGWLLGPGQAVFVPLGKPISYVSYRGSRYGHFGIEWLRLQSAPHVEAGAVMRRAADPQAFRYAYEGLCHELLNKRDELVMHDWLQVIDQLARRVILGRDRPSPLAVLLNAMELDLAYPWTVADMAGVAASSESVLRRLFHLELGESPIQCLGRLRLARAAVLLTGSRNKLSVIADQVGYGTPFALSKAFKARYGKCPRAYREHHGAV